MLPSRRTRCRYRLSAYIVCIFVMAAIANIILVKYQSHNAMVKTEPQYQFKYLPENATRMINVCRSADSIIDITNSTYEFIESASKIEEILERNNRTVSGYSCQVLFDYDLNEIVPVNLYNKTLTRISNSRYQNMTKNCEQFKQTRGYLDSPFTEIEENFPIAFSVVAYKEIEQLERLLRAIYRPQNYYCIHMDAKSQKDDVDTIKSITACFDNMFIPEQRVDVVWGTLSVLDAELVCMRDLFAKKDWKYFINLTGQEFPLKTNLEIVKILEAMKGANLVDGTLIRANRTFQYRWIKAGEPPHDILPIKGSVHIAVNRCFVQFALYDTRSRDFLQWLSKTEIPDEIFFASLNHNPHLKIPGSFLGDPEEYPRKPTFTRYKNWVPDSGVWVRRCAGKFLRDICILGVGDLGRLKDDISLFVNKFHIDYQPLAYECMEELIFNRTRDQYLQRMPIDVAYYSYLDQVRLQMKN